jgi:hypothetical protein
MGAGAANRLRNEALAALGATPGKHFATVGGSHAGTEAVRANTLDLARLEGAFCGHGGYDGSEKMGPAGYAGAASKSTADLPLTGFGSTYVKAYSSE